MAIRRTSTAAAVMFLGAGALALFAQQVQYKPGDRVDVDIIMAGAPERAMWRAGSVKAVDSETREVIVSTDAATENGGRGIGIPFQMAPRWLRPSTQPQPSPPPTRGTAKAPARAPSPQTPSTVAAPPTPVPPASVPQEILACPVDQPKVA